jgi:protein-L-isoaspartate(D-aspartate) O-methyltransferase
MHRLMTADARALCDPAGNGPLTGYDQWITAFEAAGQALAGLSRRGLLTRGLRAVLAHHIIFHANRAGLPAADQSALAAVALETVFATGRDTAPAPAPIPATTKVTHVNTLSDDRSALSAAQFRAGLAGRLLGEDVIRTPAVADAFNAVPRDRFVPGVPLEQAYADDAVYTKTTADGIAVSAASQPRIVAMMLEQLAAQPGQQIMEAGAGTGYNAALLAAIVGDKGHVTTIDVDQDLVDGAREHLAAAGVRNVSVILGDGALGYPGGAPYDRVIATVSAYEIPAAWLAQLSPAGRLVAPLRLRGTTSRSIAFERSGDGWCSVSSELAVFMPLRGIADDAPRTITLTPERDVTLEFFKDQAADADALSGVLGTGRHENWTGVLFPPMVAFEWMDLWLACTLGNALMRMSVQPPAADRGQASPMFGWGSMATTRGSDLAYLTVRPAPADGDGGKLYEVGVIGHGPAGQDLAEQVAGQVRTWDKEYRTRPVRFEIPATPAAADPAAGQFVLHRPDHPVTVIWE